jgi:tetratricopeptide (TPR) repeat protein
MANSSTRLRRPLRTRILQNFYLVWLDENIDENHDDYPNSINQLQQVVNTINTFIDADECIDFVTDMTEETALMIVSERFSEDVLPVVRDIFQIKSVYIMCKNKTELENWDKKWPKVQGTYTDIPSICRTIRGDSKVCDYNAVSISYIKKNDESSAENLDTLDCSFMYTQILKDILLTIDFTREHIDQFLNYCREQFADSKTKLSVVKKIEDEYYDQSPIRWYTSDTFLYGMLNRALRLMDVEVIVKIGFFLRDVHQQLTRLHDEQFGEPDMWDPFIVYRGQSLPTNEFNKLKSTKDGLLSFNNFLSTSFNRDVGKLYADNNLGDPDVMGVLFVITIDVTISVTSFALITSESYFGGGEGEVLFSMHSIFRIGEMKQLDDNERLWQIKLTLTNDNDSQLMAVMKSMQKDISSKYRGWHRLGKLLMKLGQYDKAQELYETLLEQTNNEQEQAYLYHMSARVYDNQGNYPKAVRYYSQSLEIKKKTVHARHPSLIPTYSNIALVCEHMGQYSRALEFYEICLRLSKKYLPANHPDLATIYNNSAAVYINLSEYAKALEYYEKALEIWKEKLPTNHPTLATSYNNLAWIHEKIGEHSKAIEYCEKALNIKKRILPPNHPDVAASLNSIGIEHYNAGNYSRALEYYESALDIWQKSLFENHPNLAILYNNISMVCAQMNENSKALVYCEKALNIMQKNFFPDHPNLAASYAQLGTIHCSMGEYTRSLEYFEKAIDIRQKVLPPNHPDLATAYINLGLVYKNMDDNSKALEYLEKAIDIRQKVLPPNHPDLVTAYSNLGRVCKNMNDNSKALEYCTKAIEVLERTPRPTHPNLAAAYTNLGEVYKDAGDNSKALEYLKKAIDIRQKVLPPNHPDLATDYSNLGRVCQNMNDNSKALEYGQKAIEIFEKNPQSNHPKLGITCNN